ncbi:MAG: discoidin domain-containing protein [Verrucomicrobiae bacterium]|nr:discoidin domain-containing protein [Verrucomicrobiae bacterium]
MVRLFADALSFAQTADLKKMVLAALGKVAHPGALELAVGCMPAEDADVEIAVATAVAQIAKSVKRANRDAAKAAVQKVLDACKTPAARQLCENAFTEIDNMTNIAPQGVASSPDDLDKDGASHGDQAAIDGNPDTYWDEKDHQPLYRLVVTFKQPEKIAAISVLGYQHHRFSPKDFEVLCDGKIIKKVENAQYDNNFLIVTLDETTATTVELKITGYYGGSSRSSEPASTRRAAAGLQGRRRRRKARPRKASAAIDPRKDTHETSKHALLDTPRFPQGRGMGGGGAAHYSRRRARS